MAQCAAQFLLRCGTRVFEDLVALLVQEKMIVAEVRARDIRYVGARLTERDSWLRAYVPVLVSGWNLIIARTPSATKTVSTAS
jgi:hypothetical protein